VEVVVAFEAHEGELRADRPHSDRPGPGVFRRLSVSMSVRYERAVCRSEPSRSHGNTLDARGDVRHVRERAWESSRTVPDQGIGLATGSTKRAQNAAERRMLS
jgi:hypothetical protein